MMLSNKKLANPFVYQGYESPAYCCDREAETKSLLSHLKNGRNITLISPRRIGKTGLIGAPDKPCGVGRADANPKLLLNDT